eukprot:scaffold305039_cov15-Prasinocladus_malaysianus.AAC.1
MIIDVHYVFDRKCDIQDTIISHKVCAVANGGRLTQGVHYAESYAATMQFTSLRTLVSLAAANGWSLN